MKNVIYILIYFAVVLAPIPSTAAAEPSLIHDLAQLILDVDHRLEELKVRLQNHELDAEEAKLQGNLILAEFQENIRIRESEIRRIAFLASPFPSDQSKIANYLALIAGETMATRVAKLIDRMNDALQQQKGSRLLRELIAAEIASIGMIPRSTRMKHLIVAVSVEKSRTLPELRKACGGVFHY